MVASPPFRLVQRFRLIGGGYWFGHMTGDDWVRAVRVWIKFPVFA